MNIKRLSNYREETIRKSLFLIATAMIIAITLAVISCSGGDEAAQTPIPGQSSCLADFFAELTTLEGPDTVHFTDQSTGEIIAWAWDFNNNGTIDSTIQNPSYFYDHNGKFSVTLTVTGLDCTNTLTKKDYINVTGCKD
jgi:PKD repeat protein